MSLGALSYRGGTNYHRERLIIPTSLNHPSSRSGSPESQAASASSWKPSSRTEPQDFLNRRFLRVVMKLSKSTGVGAYVLVLALTWLCSIYYMERSLPYSAFKRCHWPMSSSKNSRKNTSRVALVADPQLIDDNSYPGRPKSLLTLTKYIVDTYLRRNWVYMNRALDPDAIVFLGDLFDGGREWEDKLWNEEFDRWNQIFTKPPLKKTIMSLPGNHDIGYGDTIVPHALDRFEAFFGPPSSSFVIANHTIILLDTISMMNTKEKTIYERPRAFMDNFALDMDPHSHRILMTHVPLFRPKGSSCGRERESPNDLSYTKGYQYQTQINPEFTNEILEKLQPAVVFSGDDHDACHVEHSYYIKDHQYSASEYTVKSFSMAMGIASPGMQLLELDGNSSVSASSSFETSICLMPSPFAPFIMYGILAIFSLGAVVLYNFHPRKLPLILQKLHAGAFDSVESYLPLHKEKAPSGLKTRHPLRQAAIDCIILFTVFILFFTYLRSGLFKMSLN